MIYLTTEENEKLKLIDTLFKTIPVEQLTELAQREDIVLALRGVDDNLPGPVQKLINDYSRLNSDVQFMKTRINEQNADLKRLLDIMSANPYNTSTSTYTSSNGYSSNIAGDFQSLKQTVQYRSTLC